MSVRGPSSVKELAKQFQKGQLNNASGSLSLDTSADRALALEAHMRTQRQEEQAQASLQSHEDAFVQTYQAQLALHGDVDKALAETEKLLEANAPKPQALTFQFDEVRYGQALEAALLEQGDDLDSALAAVNRQFGLV